MIRNAPLHHIGIVQMNEEQAQSMMEMLGLEEDYRGYVAQWSALCIFTKATAGSPIEFVIPDSGPLLKFNGGLGGYHHMALQVEDLDALSMELQANDMRFLEPQHVKGAGNFICNFLAPGYTRGLTIEFVQLLD